ncbi:MAG: hypothetical protein COA80_15360 [Leeuwenhoekiella sp.]|nr:MAG: hypothetical protein COA80_15360 [Leeuwenhoekiella sp.]
MNTLQDIIIWIGIILGVVLFKWTKPVILKVILVGLILTFVLPFLSTNILIINVTSIAFGILSLTYSIHCAINKNWTNLIIGIFAFATFFWALLNWQYYGELQLLMIIPFGIYILTVIKWKKNINQLSLLSIFGMYELSVFLRLIKQWLN